ncbi:GroES-like protein [Xylariaceae sp. FL1651]|nr:GroES-like protein [Xylariaceae sp. FL1651]
MRRSFPTEGAIIGNDFAGKIIDIDYRAGELRPDLRIGDRVCGLVHGSNPDDPDNGAFARYVRADAQLVIKVLDSMGLSQAATLGVALATNCLALWESLNIPATLIQPSSALFDVLVYGGSTCCGTMAIQLLKLSGARVVTTCSPKNFALVKAYGADLTFDYAERSTPEIIRGNTRNRLRYALDCITDDDSVACCYTALGRIGARYTCLEHCHDELQTRKAVKFEFLMSLEVFGKPVRLEGAYGRDANPSRHKAAVAWFREFQRMVDEGKLIVHPTEMIEGGLDGVIKGLQRLQTGSVSGTKLVASISSEVLDILPYSK